MTKFSAPSKLANSAFLRDLSTVSGTDFVGPNVTSRSLGLADTYTVNLMTSCGSFSNGTTKCTSPHLGFSFDPAFQSLINSSSLEAPSQDFLDAQSSFNNVGKFVPIGYIAGSILLLLATLLEFANGHVALVVAAVFGVITTIVYLASTIAGLVVTRKFDSAFNSHFGSAGLTTEVGKIPLGLGFNASLLALIVTIVFIIRARNPASARRGMNASYGGPPGPLRKPIITGADPLEAEPLTRDAEGPGQGGQDPTLWGRIPAFAGHNYVQVEKQGNMAPTSDWSAEDAHDPSQYGHAPRDEASIPLQPMHGNRSFNANTAYEPYQDRSVNPETV